MRRPFDLAATLLAAALVMGAILPFAPVRGADATSAAEDPSPAASPTLTPGPDRPPALAAHEVFGYLPSWELDDGDPIDLSQVTTLAWFGVEAGPDGHLVRVQEDGAPSLGWDAWMGEDVGALAREAQAAGARVVLVVERFSWTDEDTAETVALLGDPAARAVLVEEIVAAVAARGADGAQLDVEPLPPAVRDGLSALVRELRAAMNASDPALQLTVALTPDVSSYDVKALVGHDAADAVVLMGYEYRTPSAGRSGSLAPLADPAGLDLRETVRTLLSLAPADRVILALPWYGRAWTTRDGEPGSRTRGGDRFLGPTTPIYDVAVGRAEVAGRRYERGQAAAWSVYPGSACDTCPVAPRQLWYDDVDAFRAKVRFALRQGLRGVGIWALGYQGTRPELWSALRVARGAVTDTTAPAGTLTVDTASITGDADGRPVVGDTIALMFTADDGVDGTGVAFVRIATARAVRGSGELRGGVTFPVVDRVLLDTATGDPVQEVLRPAPPDPAASASPFAEPTASPRPGRAKPPRTRTFFVQWRDVAGNWSAPVATRVRHQSDATPAAVSTAAP